MSYISADGTIRKQQQAPPKSNPRLLITFIIIAIAICLKYNILLPSSNPLANGAIPAATKMPNEHWSTIVNDDLFVRKMTEGLEKSKADTEVGRRILQAVEMEDKLTRTVDFMDTGGPDGHVAEEVDLDSRYFAEGVRVTRCSTTRTAITAYMCGAAVATNNDVARGYKRKRKKYGTSSFADYIQCRYKEGERKGGNRHRRAVYRLGISCKENKAGYSHAWSIVAQPDGTYFWLQSFISHYSLATWMNKVDSNTASGLSGHLTYSELMKKLERVDRLRNINSWTDQANDDYFDLFNVDKREDVLKLESSTIKHRGHTSFKWTPDQRLEAFLWDEACEYPLPEGEKMDDDISLNNPGDERLRNLDGHMQDEIDECAIKKDNHLKLIKKLLSQRTRI